jgi:hypothetical protein
VTDNLYNFPSPEENQPGPVLERQRVNWSSAVQFALSALGLVMLWSSAVGTFILALTWRFDQAMPVESATPMFLLAAGLFFSGVLLIPSGGLALLDLFGRGEIGPRWIARFQLQHPGWLILIAPLALLAGYWVSQNQSLAWLLLPPLHLVAVAIPVWWLYYLGRRGLPTAEAQRTWGVLASGLVLGPVLILIAELAVLLLYLVIGGLYLASNPQLSSDLVNLAQRLSFGAPSPEAVQRLLAPFLLRPVVAYLALVFGAVLVPLIEELIKPIGVWLLVGRQISPRDGFAAGLLSGAGYALFENLAFSSNAQDWAWVVLIRIGTAVMHIFTAGLTGWALALAWRERRYLRLGVAYLTAVTIHGLWNGLTLLSVGAELAPADAAGTSFVFRVAAITPYALFALALTTFITLLWANSSFRKVSEGELHVT